MNDERCVFLSHPWGPSCPAYGNGDRIRIEKCQSIDLGESCNKLKFSADNHTGTHFDFPFHFDQGGKRVTDYAAGFFEHTSVALWWQDCNPGELLGPDLFVGVQGNLATATLLLVRTGSVLRRNDDSFWNRGNGFDLGLADFLRQKMPCLTTVAIDTISISSWIHRNTGRQVHRDFLADSQRPIVLIEDFNPEPLNRLVPKRVICSPLRIEAGDGGPCTLMAWL
jgi:arylformamidase